MPSMDIFEGDAFSLRSLTDAINKIKFVPGWLSARGIFNANGIPTDTAMIEEKNGVLSLISPTPRGGPGQTLDKGKRALRPITIPHFEINDAVMAIEVQGIRAFGSETETETVQGKVAERLGIATQSLAATEEYARIGAVKGVVTYADGSTLDLFDVFDVSQIGELDMNLDSSADDGSLREDCAGIVRTIAGELDGTPFSGVTALCSDSFYDALIKNKEVRGTYLNQAEAAQLRGGYVDNGGAGIFGSFNFGGIDWFNYRGAVGGVSFIDADKAHFFPTGVPGLFRTLYGPADYEETVNTMGLARYARQYAMPNGKGRNLDSQMNSLNICTRPRVLLKGKIT